ncbi:MAG: hypothetical protein WC755_07890 [Candidatus Woesearchaeota archaeon]|jgi:hypothetical protein
MEKEQMKVVWGNYIFDHGYFNISNLLIDSQEELGITDDELLFIIKIQRFSGGWTILDSKLSKSLCSKSLQRRRKTLKEKGLLDTIERKEKDEQGQIRTYGIIYNFSGLDKKLREISEKKLELDDRKKICADRTVLSKKKTEVSALNKTISIRTNTSKISEDPKRVELNTEIIATFKNQYIKFKENNDFQLWGPEMSWPHTSFKPSKKDLENLNNLDLEDLELLNKSSKHLSDYIYFELESKRFIGSDGYFTPTLSLFSKSKVQFNKLYRFYLDANGLL